MARCYENGNDAPRSVKGGVSVRCRGNDYVRKRKSASWSLLVFRWETGRQNNLEWLAKIFVLYSLL
jgi:hypothetical protein